MKSDGDLPDDPLIHVAVMGYSSDTTVLDSIITTHGLSWGAGPDRRGHRQPFHLVPPAVPVRRLDALRHRVAGRRGVPRPRDGAVLLPRGRVAGHRRPGRSHPPLPAAEVAAPSFLCHRTVLNGSSTGGCGVWSVWNLRNGTDVHNERRRTRAEELRPAGRDRSAPVPTTRRLPKPRRRWRRSTPATSRAPARRSSCPAPTARCRVPPSTITSTTRAT